MNIVFMGTPDFSVKILKDLHEKYPVSLVVTQPDKQVGRKKVITFSPVKKAAIELGIEVFQPTKIKTDYKRILDHNTEIIMEPPTNTLGKVYIVNTVSDDPKKWYILD